LGGGEFHDHQGEFGSNGRHGIMDGYLISGIAGVNVPLGKFFVGAEGDIAKGTNDIDWEYGVKGRAGLRAGNTGLVYISAGYEWVRGKTSRGYPHRSDMIYGGGVEVGPQDLGMGGSSSGIRLRLQADTYNFHSIRPMAGIVFHM
jgi:opacity protein-like surface antigen